MTSARERTRAFHRLHESGCFVLPNPWDPGGARVLEQLGFAAIATTSAGFAWSRARPDNGVTVEQVLEHCRALAASVRIPVNADFEGGFAVAPEGVADSVARAAETGIAGLSIEDSIPGAHAAGDEPLFDHGLAVERIRAAREAIDSSGTEILLTGRSEGFLVGRPDLDETIRRLSDYADAGADCLYAPGLRTAEQIGAVVQAVAPKPVNVLAGPGATVAALAELGVRRVSVGGALARVAWAGLLRAAEEISSSGTFAALEGGAPFADLNRRFTDDR